MDTRLHDSKFNPPLAMISLGQRCETLFDYYAAAALAGAMAYHNQELGDAHTNATPDSTAHFVSMVAIAMLNRRAELFGVTIEP